MELLILPWTICTEEEEDEEEEEEEEEVFDIWSKVRYLCVQGK